MPAFAAFAPHKPTACSPQRRQCSTARSSVTAHAACSRRRAVAGGLLLPALVGQLVQEARAEEAAALVAEPAAQQQAAAPSEPAAAAAAPWKKYIAREFSFSYPPDLRVIEDDIFQQPYEPAMRSTLQGEVEQPVKARLESSDGMQRISVVVKLASRIKPTLFQVTDISQWGTAREVAKLLLPSGAVVASYDTIAFPQPPKDTGTILGSIQRDPVTLYRYQVQLPDKSEVAMAVGAQKGQIYVMGASATQDRWVQVAADLKRCAESFRLVM